MGSRARRHLFDDDDRSTSTGEHDPLTRLKASTGRAGRTTPAVLRADGLTDAQEGYGRPTRGYTNKTAPSDDDSALSRITSIVQQDYPELLTDGFQPVSLALEMLDTTSLGRHRELDNFRNINKHLERSLQAHVNTHFQGFNSSIGMHASMEAALDRCQRQVKEASDMLLRAKAQLSIQRLDLVELNGRTRQLQDSLQILEEIAELKRVPDEIESALSVKNFSRVVSLYTEANVSVHRDALLNMPALRDIRGYLRTQSTNLVEVLVEELQNHLYLKSPYCDTRWAAYKYMQTDLPRMEEVDVVTASIAYQHDMLDSSQAKVHPEADSRRYVNTLVDALQALGKLPFALDHVLQRMPTEIAATVFRTTGEVSARYPHVALGVKASVYDGDGDVDEQTAEPLRDLFWTLFSKWTAMMDIIAHFQKSTSSALDTSASSFPSPTDPMKIKLKKSAIWQAFEHELRRIMSLYLSTGDQEASLQTAAYRRKDDLFTQARTSGPARKHSETVQLGTVAVGIVRSDEEEMSQMLREAVPGLMTGNDSIQEVVRSDSMVHVADRHSVLVQPSALNVVVLLQPAVALLRRIEDFLPTANASADYTSQLLDDLFYSHLSSAVDQFLAIAFVDNTVGWTPSNAARARVGSGYQALDVPVRTKIRTNRADLSPNIVHAMALTTRIAAMIDMMPASKMAHDATLVRVLHSVLAHAKARYEQLVARQTEPANGPRISAAWSARPQVGGLWQDLLEASVFQTDKVARVNKQEIEALRELRMGFTFSASWLLTSGEYTQLIELYMGLRTFAAALFAMLPRGAQLPGKPWLLPEKEALHTFRSALPSDVSLSYRTTAENFCTMLRTVLLCIRLELRAQLIMCLHRALLTGNLSIDEKTSEIDPSFGQLNSILMTLYGGISRLLPREEESFVMLGLTQTIDDVLIYDCDKIPAMSSHGAEKMSLSILALQQNLRNAFRRPTDVSLVSSRRFYEIFSEGVEALIRHATLAVSASHDHGELDRYMHLIRLHVEHSSASADPKAVERHVNATLAKLRESIKRGY
ncbi:exocyst subunit [Savitreella phatthalungensis]